MVTHRSRVMSALRGEMVDRLPFVPRLDLWYLANSTRGTLPPKYADASQNDIARAEGWTLHHRFCDNQLDPVYQPQYLHRGINIFYSRDYPFDVVLPRNVEITVERHGPRTRVEYHTPLGMVSTTTYYDVQSQQNGITIPALVEHLIKTPADYAPAGYLFEHMDVMPSFERFERWSEDDMRQDGQPVAVGSFDASPFHWMQRDLSDPTQFFIHYRDHHAEMSGLAERIGALLDKVLTVLKQSPAEVVWWGANFDDMLTYPPYFEKEIQPWIRKAAETLGAAGKLVLVHTDGENTGLMDLIRDSGAHVAESITPAPLTRLPFSEYYRRWSPHLTLFGGIPSTILLPGTSEADFEAHLDGFFRAIAPGARMVVGVADEVPPEAVFSRLQRLGDRLEREGRLPIEAGAFRPAPAAVAAAKPAEPTTEAAKVDETFAAVHEAVITGKHVAIKEHVQALLDRGVDASAILDQGLIAAITVVGNRMAAGTAFIPHVLLAARAMAAGMSVLEPHLMAGGGRMRGRILIGTVAGDMHDIGKNLVATLLRGEGFEIRDLGINVSRQTFCDEIAAFRPHVVGLSALLTTTMMEMKAVIGALEERQLRTHHKVIVGGAPVSEPFARQIGADGYAANAVEAVQLAKRLVAEVVSRHEA